jgi:subtilisin family serine protease
LPEDFGAIAKVEGKHGWHVLQFENTASAQKAGEFYENQSDVKYIDYDKNIYVPNDADTPVLASQSTSRSSSVATWDVRRIRAQEANQAILDAALSLPEIIVAVIDTGIIADHDYFLSDPANPRVLPDVYPNLEDSLEFNEWHGTHVAGIIAKNTLPNIKIKSYNGVAFPQRYIARGYL